MPRLHAKQQIVMDNPARFVVMACGRRFGKSELGKIKLVQSCLQTSYPYAYVAPTKNDTTKMWDEIYNLTHQHIVDISKQERWMKFASGAQLRFFWSDNGAIDRIRSNAFKGVVIDESAAIRVLEYGWTRVILPTLADYGGWCWFLSSFKGKNYFFSLYSRAIDPMNEEWAGFSFTTADNPYIDPAEIELARKNSTERAFQEEYMAIPNDDYGVVFRRVQDCITDTLPTQPDRVVMGIDWGRANDFTVLTVMDGITRTVLEVDRFNQINWNIQRGRVKALADKWQPMLILAEENSIGQPNIEALQSEGLPVQPFVTTSASKGQLIDDLALAFEQQTIGIPNDPVLINELQAYEMERLPSGVFRYSAPAGGHDDMVMSLALAYRAASTSRLQLWIF